MPPRLGHRQSGTESGVETGGERPLLSLWEELQQGVWGAGVKGAMAEHTLHSIASPVLSEAQISQAANCTTLTPKHYQDGETLIAIGDRAFKFFIVKSGEVEIIDYSSDEPKTITIHRKGQFTGEISHLTGTPAIFRAVARGDCQVFEISEEP